MADRRSSSGDEVTRGDLHEPQVVHEKGHRETEVEISDLVHRLGDRHDGMAPVDDIEYVMDKIETLSVEFCLAEIPKILKYHEYDYNYSDAQREKLKNLAEGPIDKGQQEEWELELKTEIAIHKYYSPYPEVRAITTPVDDPTIPCETFRAHFLGLLWAVVGQFTNSLFNSRFPAITLSSSVIQLLLYPCGKLLALILPDWGFTVKGTRVSLNPGPWTYKEQMLATIIVNVGAGSAYCFWNIQTQTVYYHDTWLTPGYGIMLLLSTQMMGLGFAGLLRRFVIYPIETMWPSILPTVALNRTLLVPEKKESLHGWTISRYKFFFLFFAISFVYFWIPDFLFSALSYFAWMTWIAPNNFTLNMITGSQYGLGFNPIPTFDWNYVSAYTQPLAYPFFATAQQFAGTLIGGFGIIGLWYTNTRWTAYLPPNTSGIFDNTGSSYNISRILVPGTAIVNQTEYEAYSPPFYGAGNLWLYGAFFAFYPLTMVFILLDAWRPLLRAYRSMCRAVVSQTRRIFNGFVNFGSNMVRGKPIEACKQLWAAFEDDGSSIYDEFDNPLTQLMRAYPEVPDWWFLMIALISFIFAIIIVTHWPQLETPVWTVFFVIGLNLVFLIPMSYLYAISGSTEGLNVVTELVVGYALPGHPEALMFVKAFGYNINGQADNYISDQKMGFYAKVPPRAMYRGQVMSAFICALVAYGVVQFVDTTVEGICTPDQASDFTCVAGSQVYFSSSVVWGAIGPERIFSQIYPILQYTFLFGFLMALAWWSVKRFGSRLRSGCHSVLPSAIYTPLNMVVFKPISYLKHVHPSLVFNGAIFWAPTNLSYFTGGLYFSFAFMYYLRRYKTSWWEKYNYVLSAALTAGVAFSGIIIFFAVQWDPKEVSWWGNNVLGATIDGGAGRLALYEDLPAKGYFGPDSWH